MRYDLEHDLILAGVITEYLTSAMVDNYSNGNKKTADQQAIDSCIVQGMSMCLNFYDVHGSDTEFDEVILDKIKATIHEYEDAQMLDVTNFSVNVAYDSTALGTVNPIMVFSTGTTFPIPHKFSWTVESDAQTIFPVLPFDISEIDSNSISLILNDADPIIGDDYSISGSTLTWTGNYPLSAGWKFEITYWQISSNVLVSSGNISGDIDGDHIVFE